MNEYEIKKAPLELIERRRKPNYPFDKMKVGEMFEVSYESSKTRDAIYTHIKKFKATDTTKVDWIFILRKINIGKVAVIRIK